MGSNNSSELMQIVGALIGLVTTIFTGYMAYLVHKINVQAKLVGTEVKDTKDTVVNSNQEVKSALARSNASVNEKLTTTAQIADATHSIVTSAVESQLSLHALTARRLASITRNPEDVKAAELAEKAYQEYLQKQAQLPTSMI